MRVSELVNAVRLSEQLYRNTQSTEDLDFPAVSLVKAAGPAMARDAGLGIALNRELLSVSSALYRATDREKYLKMQFTPQYCAELFAKKDAQPRADTHSPGLTRGSSAAELR